MYSKSLNSVSLHSPKAEQPKATSPFLQTPESFSTTKTDLGNTSYSESFTTINGVTIQQDNDGYIALKNENNDTVHIGVIQSLIDIINQTPDNTFKMVSSVRNINLKDFVVVDNGKILNDDITTKFYVGSLYVIGLYIFYRILVKNN